MEQYPSGMVFFYAGSTAKYQNIYFGEVVALLWPFINGFEWIVVNRTILLC